MGPIVRPWNGTDRPAKALVSARCRGQVPPPWSRPVLTWLLRPAGVGFDQHFRLPRQRTDLQDA